MSVPEGGIDRVGKTLLITISAAATFIALAAIIVCCIQRMKYRSEKYSDDVMLATAERRTQQQAPRGGCFGAMRRGGPKPNAMGGTAEPKDHLVGLPKSITQGGGAGTSSGVGKSGRVGRNGVGVTAATATGAAAAGSGGVGAVNTPYYSARSSETNSVLSTPFDSASETPFPEADALRSKPKSPAAGEPADTDTYRDQRSSVGRRDRTDADGRGSGGRFWQREEEPAPGGPPAAAAAAAGRGHPSGGRFWQQEEEIAARGPVAAAASAAAPRGHASGGVPGPIAESAASPVVGNTALNSPFALSESAVQQHQQQQQQAGEGRRRHEEIEIDEDLAPCTSSMGFGQLSNAGTSFGDITELPSSEYDSRGTRV